MPKLYLVDLLSLRHTTNFARNTVTNRTDRAYALVYRTYSVDRRMSHKQPGGPCSKEWRRAVKMGDVSKTTPLLGVIFHLFDIVSLCTKFESSSFSHS